MIRKILLLLLFVPFYESVIGQNSDPGVTVIVHGFAAFSLFNTDFLDFGEEIRKKSGGGTVYKINRDGQWEYHSGSKKADEEIIVVNDWSNLSSNMFSGSKFGNLEAAADHLFAALLSPPDELSITGTELIKKPLHFIGHSRGAILLLQVCHRFRRYFPLIGIDQLTLLDPHPATPFGDVITSQPSSISSLPCVIGKASDCYPPAGCYDGSDIEIKIPENVVHADAYWREDGRFEELVIGTNLDAGAFDGVLVNIPNKGILNNEIMKDIPRIIPYLGGAHAAVVDWYRGTISPNIKALNQNWYTPSIGSFFSNIDTRYTVGYFQSRIGSGGDENQLPKKVPESLKASLAEMNDSLNLRQGFGGGLQRIFNGNFVYERSGWEEKGGLSNFSGEVVEEAGVFTKYFRMDPHNNIANSRLLKHAYFYFGGDENNNTYQSLRFTVKVKFYNPNAGLIVRFYNKIGEEISGLTVPISIQPNLDKLINVSIPEQLRKSVGTFSIENLKPIPIYLSRFDLSTATPVPTSSASLQATFVRSEQAVHLDWSDFTIDEIAYIVSRADSLNGSYDHLVATLPPNSNFVTDTLIDANATYWYRVQSVSPTITDGYTNIDSITIVEKPPAPAEITAAVFNDRDIKVRWNDATDVETGYELYYKMDNGAGYSLLKSLPANTTTYTLSNVAANTTISFYLRSRELKFLSEPSPEAFATVGRGAVFSRITKVEAYIDDMPGAGQPIILSGDLSKPEVFASATIPVQFLSDGLHTIYIRSLDTKQYWSNTYTGTFLKLSPPAGGVKLRDLQYAINATSGGAVWNDVYIGPEVNANEGITVTIQPSIVADLPDGIHFITIRAKDNQGFWSNYFHQSFLKLNGTDDARKVVSLQYSIDNGLLIGTGTAVTLTPGNYANVSIDLPPLSNGKHYLSLRAKDDGGYYSNITIDSFVVRDQSFCEKNSIVHFRSLINNAKTYAWQQNDGNEWVTLTNGGLYSGARTQILQLDNPPTAWYGYQFRCIVNGVPTAPFTLKFGDTWSGAESDEWHNPNNWYCGGVPDEFTDVIIDPSAIRKPKITANGVCRSLTLKPGSTVIVQDGNTLDIKGHQ